MDTQKQAAEFTSKGLRRLFLLAQTDSVKYLRKHLPDIQKMCLHYVNVQPSPFGDEKLDSNQTPCEQLKTDWCDLQDVHQREQRIFPGGIFI